MSHEFLAWQLSIRLRPAGSCQHLYLKRMTQATDSNCCPSLSGAALTIHKRFYSHHPTSIQEKRGRLPPMPLNENWGGWSLTETSKALTNTRKVSLILSRHLDDILAFWRQCLHTGCFRLVEFCKWFEYAETLTHKRTSLRWWCKVTFMLSQIVGQASKIFFYSSYFDI